MKRLFAIIGCLIPFFAIAETNAVYYKESTGEVMSYGWPYKYNVDKDSLTLVTTNGVETMSGINWTVIRLGGTISDIPEVFTNISQITVNKVLLPMSDEDKGDWKNRFTKEELGIMAAIKLIVSKLPAQYRPTNEEIKQAIKEEL